MFKLIEDKILCLCWYKALYLLVNEVLNMCSTTLMLLLNERLIIVCCFISMLFITSQQLHKSPMLSWCDLFDLACVPSTLLCNKIKCKKKNLTKWNVKKNQCQIIYIPICCCVFKMNHSISPCLCKRLLKRRQPCILDTINKYVITCDRFVKFFKRSLYGSSSKDYNNSF